MRKITMIVPVRALMRSRNLRIFNRIRRSVTDGHFFFTTTRPSFPKEGTSPSPNLSPHGERLNRRMAETAHSSTLLVSRDTRWVIYRLARGKTPYIIYTIDKHRGVWGREPPKDMNLNVKRIQE